jgi:hypothetical protein
MRGISDGLPRTKSACFGPTWWAIELQVRLSAVNGDLLSGGRGRGHWQERCRFERITVAVRDQFQPVHAFVHTVKIEAKSQDDDERQQIENRNLLHGWPPRRILRAAIKSV